MRWAGSCQLSTNHGGDPLFIQTHKPRSLCVQLALDPPCGTTQQQGPNLLSCGKNVAPGG